MKSNSVSLKDKNSIGSKRATILILVLFSILYFLIFLPANNTGAKDVNMLGAFNNDEYAQYPFVIHMITPGETFYQSIHNFAVYSYYFYGYPFFFLSALVLLPYKLFAGSSWSTHTQTIILILRQVINVLPMLGAILLIIYTQTRFRYFFRSIILFVFLAIISGVTYNSTWWHPDSLLTLFAVLTIFFLLLDDFRLGKYYLVAAIFCGLAIGTKQPGVFFFITIPFYAIWSGITNRNKFYIPVLKLFLFVAIMIGTVILSNPLLLLPIERGEIIQSMTKGYSQNMVGIYSQTPGSLIKWIFSIDVVTKNNGTWPFLLVCLISLVLGIFDKHKRLVSSLILTWLLPFVVFIVFFETTMKPYYFLPVLIPLVSSLDNVFSRISWAFFRGINFHSIKNVFQRVLIIAFIVVLVWQSFFFLKESGSRYLYSLSREEKSQSLKFFNFFEEQTLAAIPADTPLKIYRDWKIYLPADQPHWQYFYTFDLADYDYIDQIQPDFILLEFENINYFSNPELLANPVEMEKATNRYDFYSDAKSHSIDGYVYIAENSFGTIFASKVFYNQYLK
jgi:hypothetical protein